MERKTADTPDDVFKRLGKRGFSPQDYGVIRQILDFSIPQWMLLFSRQFGSRSITQVLRQIRRWKHLLKDDFILPESQKGEIDRTIKSTELAVWHALIQANLPQVGPWRLQMVNLPTGEDEHGQPLFNFPPLQITATHHESKEVRQVVIPAEEANDPSLLANAYEKAFEKLGLGNLLYKGQISRGLISARKPRGWPIFTQIIVPRLYEFMAPHYQQPGHYSEHRDQAAVELDRPALFPRELLEDMLEILKMENPSWFADTTVSHLKAVIQRYLKRKSAGTNLPQTARRT